MFQILTKSLQLKDVDFTTRIVKGYFSAFDSLDSDGDIITKGAFSKTLSENKHRVKHLQNHDTTKPLGAIQEIYEDSYGLFYTSKIGTHTLGEEFLKMADSGLITEHSIGFQTVKQEKSKGINYIKEVKLWEGSSLTAWGSNGNTPLLKSMTKQQLQDRIKVIEKFCKNSTCTEETIELLLLEIKQLSELIEDNKQNNEVNEALEKFNCLFK